MTFSNAQTKNRRKKSPNPMAFPRSVEQWFGAAILIVVFACIAQMSISFLKNIAHIPEEESFLFSLFVSHIYTAMIILVQLATGELANTYFPLTSKKSALAHIVVQSFSAGVGFFAAQQIETLIFGSCSIPEAVLAVVLGVTFILSLIGNSMYYLYFFYRRAAIAESTALEAELMALRAQINPHFLFNALNSIAALIKINPDEAEFVVEQLAEMFRWSLRASTTPLTTLDNEISFVEIYFSIEKARFQERLCVEIIIPDYLRSALVPSLLLQPLAENAVKHGANNIMGKCCIVIEAAERNGTISLTVSDDGPGFNLELGERLFAKGSGLENVRNRLLMAFPNSGELRIEKHSATLMFPFMRDNRDFPTFLRAAPVSQPQPSSLQQ